MAATSIRRMSYSPERSPYPIPFGWFQMGYSHELELGGVEPIERFGRHLVLWRDQEGVAHVNDAFCPHLGAHMGHGGKVDGCQLACPFHGWRFDAEGTNTLIPYSERTNQREKLNPYRTIERNGIIFAWYHPDDAEPTWDIPEVPEFADSENFIPMITRVFEVEAPWQEIAENGVDAAHFRYVHNTEIVPRLDAYDVDGPLAKMRSTQQFPTPRGVVDGRIDSDSFGPGFSVIRFSGIVDTILMGCNAPIDEHRCHLHFTFTARKIGDDAINSTVGEAFANEVSKQVLEDKPVWENKAHLVRPALADTDGPIMKFRKWASQFYFEDFQTGADAYPPHGAFPSEVTELTASKKFGTPDAAFAIDR
jgi:phenylpropionate dioxygenase-like ring-hydroxylating dioxygenase large terminal subunit